MNHTCPKCGHAGTDAESCERCGVIFSRMHTVIEMKPLGAFADAGRQASEVARTLGANPTAPTEEVTKLDLDKIRPVSTPRPVVELSPAPRRAPQKPAAPVVPLIPRTERERRPWLLGTLLVVSLALAWNLWRDHRAEQLAAAEPATAAKPIDAAYLNLSFEAMLKEARLGLRRIDDPEQARLHRESLLVRLESLRAALPDAAIDEARRTAYEQVLEHMSGFLDAHVLAAIEEAEQPGARPEPISTRRLEQAESAFADLLGG